MLCMNVLEPPSDMSSSISLVGNHVTLQRNSRERKVNHLRSGSLLLSVLGVVV